MLNFKLRKIWPITVIAVAVILLGAGLVNYFFSVDNSQDEVVNLDEAVDKNRHPLTGLIIEEELNNFFPVAVMLDNAADIPPQAGLAEAVVVYEALAESNITRLLAVFDSQAKLVKVGPVRSARNYFMDWAEEYRGLFMHVGGSPQALAVIDDYDFTNIDEMGASGIYFFRDDKLSAPHNVFTNSSNILRAGEMKKVNNISSEFKQWNFVDDLAVGEIKNFSINFSTELYQVSWRFNEALSVYQRWQQEAKDIDADGNSLVADNVIVQIVPSTLIDAERRAMETKQGGEVFVFNKGGQQTGKWEYRDQRTIFLDSNQQELKLVPGKTWIAIIDDPAKLIIE